MSARRAGSLMLLLLAAGTALGLGLAAWASASAPPLPAASPASGVPAQASALRSRVFVGLLLEV